MTFYSSPWARWSCVAILSAILAPAMAATSRTITLEQGQQKTWVQGRTVSRAATGDPNVVGINVVPPRGVIITAKGPGSAMISIWEEGTQGAPAAQFQVLVTPPAAAAIETLGKDRNQASVVAEGTKLRLSGSLSSLEKHAALQAAMSTRNPGGSGAGASDAGGSAKQGGQIVDTSTSAFDVQVQIDIKIVEVSRRKLKEAGFYYQRFNRHSTSFTPPNSYGGFERDKEGYTFNLTSGGVPFTDAFNIAHVSDNVWSAFSALEANGFAYSLAEPSLTALSGQTATFLAGGEIPIPFRSGTDGVSVEFKPFGVRLGLTPTVLDNDRITMKVAPEISEVDEGLSVVTGGFSVPGLRVRRTETTVALGDGETFVISGLVTQNTASAIDKFPFLGDIPVLGAFFRSNRFEREDKELLMIATPRIVRPFSKKAKLPDLPGEEVRRYDPGFFRMLLNDTSRFESSPDSGFSR